MNNQIIYKTFLFLLIIIGSISCAENKNDDIRETKGGEFYSKIGNFIIDFPTKPNYSTSEEQLGPDKVHLHIFRSTLGPTSIFNIEYK